MDAIRTARLLLRWWRKDDLDAYTNIFLRVPGGHALHRQGHPAHPIPERGANLQVHRHWDERGFGLWDVERGTSSEFIDFVGLIH